MRHKRLLVCLLLAIFVGGVVVSGAFVFRVSEISVTFTEISYKIIANEAEAEADCVSAAKGVAKGKNILFGLDRDKVKKEIERDPRVRVTNIEAKFPNKLDIKVKERFPIFVVSAQGRVAILDYELQVISTQPEASLNLGAGVRLVDIGDQFELTNQFSLVVPGDNLEDFLAVPLERSRAETFTTLVLYFLGQGHSEFQICKLIQTVDFMSPDAPFGSVVVTLTEPVLETAARWKSIRIQIHDYQVNLGAKLQIAWEVLSTTDYQNATLFVYARDGEIACGWVPPAGVSE
jgi:hypothetical protein